ncbi:MAG: hypothetical protein RL687_542 [Candidatus Parcubacteria bacterium]|jgi:hypothetical protein
MFKKDVHTFLSGSLSKAMDEKIIAFFDSKDGLNEDVFKRFSKGNRPSKTYYLCFNSVSSSKKRIKSVLAKLLKEYQINFLDGQLYYFGTRKEESVNVYAFGGDEVLIHFILSDDLMSINMMSKNHQNIDLHQSGYSQNQSLEKFGKFDRARLT